MNIANWKEKLENWVTIKLDWNASNPDMIWDEEVVAYVKSLNITRILPFWELTLEKVEKAILFNENYKKKFPPKKELHQTSLKYDDVMNDRWIYWD